MTVPDTTSPTPRSSTNRFLWGTIGGMLILGVTIYLFQEKGNLSDSADANETQTAITKSATGTNGTSPGVLLSLDQHEQLTHGGPSPAISSGKPRRSGTEQGIVPTASEPVSSSVSQQLSPPVVLSDAELSAKFVGTWKSSYHGTQEITLKADGSAQLESRLDFLSSLLYGSKLSMQLTWKVQEGVLTQVIVDGVPQGNVERLVANEGGTRSYLVLEQGETYFLLAETDDPKSVLRWERLAH
ncbi:MAG: hypothetical protein R3C01_01530 [Planctomycetaceae bacterium]